MNPILIKNNLEAN